MQSLLADPIYQSDVEMSDEEQWCRGVIGLCWSTIFFNYVFWTHSRRTPTPAAVRHSIPSH